MVTATSGDLIKKLKLIALHAKYSPFPSRGIETIGMIQTTC
jgi:hypothetical protein